MAAVDAWRALSALAIVWIHTPRSAELHPTTIVARFAVPFFVFSAVYFATAGGFRKATSTSVSSYVVSRLRRLYVPFLVWSLVYLAFKGVKLLIAPEQANDFPGLVSLFVGTAYHLWFLPFILLCTCLTFLTTRKGNGSRGLALSLPVLGLVVALVSPDAWPIHDGFKFMWFALPAALWASAWAHWVRTQTDNRDFSVPGGLLASACLLSLIALIGLGRQSLLENLFGTALCLACLQIKDLHIPTWLKKISDWSFGIYLSHLLFIKCLESVAAKLHLEISPSLDVGIFAVTILLSVLTSWLIMRSKRLSWIV